MKVTGKLIGDAALTEVIAFRVTKRQKEELERARKATGFPSIGHYVKATVVGTAATDGVVQPDGSTVIAQEDS